MAFFEKHNCLHEAHCDGMGIDATVPADLGPAPMTLRYCNSKTVVARVFFPNRIPEKKIVPINELITRLNHVQISPRLAMDYDRRLVYSSTNVPLKELEEGCDWIDLLLNNNLKQLESVHEAIIAVLYQRVSSESAVKRFMNKYRPEPEGNRGEELEAQDRLGGLCGGDPSLN